MNIKLVAVDLDDTLLDKTNKIAPRTLNTIRRAMAQGITVTVATGRMYRSALPFAKQLELDVPIITYNGAMIKSCLSEEVLYYRPIEADVTRRVLDMCRQYGWHVQAYVDDVLYAEKFNDKLEAYMELAGVDAICLGDDFYNLAGLPAKLLIITDYAEEVQSFGNIIRNELGDRVYIANSKAKYLEITHPSVNKGRALAFLAGKLGIDKSQVMAVGDSINDLDMIEYAGLGVAMGNAAEIVKQKAKAVTLANDEDGVAEAIEKYVLNDKLINS